MKIPEGAPESADPTTARAAAGPGQSAPVRFNPPVAIPDYELIEWIGFGAYGEVWLAKSAATGVLRAVKLVHRARFSDSRPFEREFEGIKKFEEVSRSHPSQLALFHVGRNEAAGCFYYVMELADGVTDGEPPQPAAPASAPGRGYLPRTLRSDLGQGRLPAARVLELALALTEGLAHLHAHGLVHRDIKPSNIIFVGGRPKLADIGLVTDASDQCSIVGTEGYLPPEGPGAPRADIFALGKVLYEALTGLDRLRYPEMPAEARAWPDRTEVFELNEILLKACAADARERYADTDAMLADLRHLAEGRSMKRRRTWQKGRRLALQLAAAAVATAVIGWLLLPRFNPPATPPPNAAAASVFVLPFKIDGTNGDNAGLKDPLYDGKFAERMTDAFINSLKLVKGVTVAPRRSALGGRPESEARAEAGRLFGVRHVLTGRLKPGDALTLALALHETGREPPVWTQTFTGTTNQLIELEEQAIRAVAAALNAPITPGTAQRVGQALTNNLAAWKLVQQAEKIYALSTSEAITASLQYYNEALQIDPDYINALAQKAQHFRDQAIQNPPNQTWPEIKAAAERMLQIDPTSWDGQYFRWITQFLYEWDWEGAEIAFQERFTRQVDWPVVTAIYLRVVGRFNEARVEQEKVKRLNRKDLVLLNHAAGAAFVDRDYEGTIAIAQETLALFPEAMGSSWWLFHAHYHLGQFDQALEDVRQMRRIQDAPDVMALEACVLAKTGQREAATKILADLGTISGVRYVDPYVVAWVHVALGDKAGAFAKLREACQKRSELLVFTDTPSGLRTDPKLDELRSEPEFQELLKLVGMDVWPKPARVP